MEKGKLGKGSSKKNISDCTKNYCCNEDIKFCEIVSTNNSLTLLLKVVTVVALLLMLEMRRADPCRRWLSELFLHTYRERFAPLEIESLIIFVI